MSTNIKIDTTLSAVIADAPPNQPETRLLTLPASLWARIDDLGQGNTKTGLAEILDFPLESRAMSANKALRNIALNLGITISTSDSPDNLLLAILRSITCLEVERNYYRDLKPQE